MLKKLLILGGCMVASALVLIMIVFPLYQAKYQRDMDVMRQQHAHQIADGIREFRSKAGFLPFQEEAEELPFMVLIGHSAAHEIFFSKDPVLRRRATWVNSSALESLLEKELGRKVSLPRDPQKVPTHAPNVYVYFISGNQMTVVTHLCYPSKQAVKCAWHGKPFYAYTLVYEFKPTP